MKHELEVDDDDEEERLEGIAIAKVRGKGAPKKKRTKDSESGFDIVSQSMLTYAFFSIETEAEEKMIILRIWAFFRSSIGLAPCVSGDMSKYCTKWYYNFSTSRPLLSRSRVQSITLQPLELLTLSCPFRPEPSAWHMTTVHPLLLHQLPN